MFKLIEESTGAGELSRHGEMLHRVAYRISRFQGTLGEGGLPVPGLYRIEGELSFDNAGTPPIAPALVQLRPAAALANRSTCSVDQPRSVP